MNKKAYYLGIILIACLFCSKTNASLVVDDFITKGPWIDVKAYGATGDGTTDDKTAIQNAINAIQGITDYSKSTIFFPPGQYCISGALEFGKSRINIVGSGMHRTQIKARSNFGSEETEMLDFSGAVDGTATQLCWTRISDLCIVGPGIDEGTDGIKIGKMVGVDIRNVIVKNCNYGLYVAHTEWSSRLGLQSVVLTDSKHGAYLKNLKGVNVNGLTLKPGDSSGDQYGLYLRGVQNSVFNNVYVEGMDVTDGLYITHDSTSKKSEGNTFLNSIFTGVFALQLDYWQYDPIKNHVFIGCNFSGKTIVNGSLSYSNNAPAYLIQCSGISNPYYIYGDFRTSFGNEEVKAHTSSDNLELIDARAYHTNKGASSDVTMTLPDVTATKGLKFSFSVLANEELRVEPYSSSNKIWGQSDGKYIYSTEVGASLTLISDGSGNWIILAKDGDWKEEGGGSGEPAKVIHHTSNDTLEASESGTYHTNKDAWSAVTLTLPYSVGSDGLKFTFSVLENQQLRVDPDSGWSYKIWGYQAGYYIYSSNVGDSLTVVSDGDGHWMIVAQKGTWTQE
jgi:hypothetical protein